LDCKAIITIFHSSTSVGLISWLVIATEVPAPKRRFRGGPESVHCDSDGGDVFDVEGEGPKYERLVISTQRFPL
jgi:hypothetical protein